MINKVSGLTITFVCLTVALVIIWQEDVKDHVPQGNTRPGFDVESIKLPFLTDNRKVSYLHFFDEDCRNSRINISHLPRITERFVNEAEFFIINTSSTRGDLLREEFSIPSYFVIIDDPMGRIARMCRVETTPYAFLVSNDLGYFYGNYNNKNGLCGSRDIKYSSPAIALDFMTSRNQIPLLPSFQSVQIGCEI